MTTPARAIPQRFELVDELLIACTRIESAIFALQESWGLDDLWIAQVDRRMGARLCPGGTGGPPVQSEPTPVYCWSGEGLGCCGCCGCVFTPWLVPKLGCPGGPFGCGWFCAAPSNGG